MFFDVNESRKRTLGMRDKQILYRNAKKRCENPACGKQIDFDEMQVGHKTAYSRGRATTLKNSACLCYRCNKLQGTDSWAIFLKKQNVVDPKTAQKQSMKQALQALNVTQLKSLATRHKVKVQGRLEETFMGSRRLAPTEAQYVTKLSPVVSQSDLKSLPKQAAPKAKPKKRKTSDDLWW